MPFGNSAPGAAPTSMNWLILLTSSVGPSSAQPQFTRLQAFVNAMHRVGKRSVDSSTRPARRPVPSSRRAAPRRSVNRAPPRATASAEAAVCSLPYVLPVLAPSLPSILIANVRVGRFPPPRVRRPPRIPHEKHRWHSTPSTSGPKRSMAQYTHQNRWPTTQDTVFRATSPKPASLAPASSPAPRHAGPSRCQRCSSHFQSADPSLHANLPTGQAPERNAVHAASFRSS
jgi:hypothetical protein